MPRGFCWISLLHISMPFCQSQEGGSACQASSPSSPISSLPPKGLGNGACRKQEGKEQGGLSVGVRADHNNPRQRSEHARACTPAVFLSISTQATFQPQACRPRAKLFSQELQGYRRGRVPGHGNCREAAIRQTLGGKGPGRQGHRVAQVK